MSRARQALRALRRRLFGPGKELAGTDQFGNKYYRVPEHESRAGRQGTAGQGVCPGVQPPIQGVQSAAACLQRGAGQQRALLGTSGLSEARSCLCARCASEEGRCSPFLSVLGELGCVCSAASQRSQRLTLHHCA